MAEDFLSRYGPPEIILQIFKNCESARDVLSLATTCRYTHAVWQTSAGDVLWPFLLREAPEFEDALIAARLTSLVHEAEMRDELPPMAVSPGQFSSRHRSPTLPELKAAAALLRAAQIMAVGVSYLNLSLPCDRESYYSWPGNKFQSEFEGNPRYGPEDPARMPEWEARVRKSFLKTLICGAALAGAYNEPLFQARASGDPELESLGIVSENPLSKSQLSFLGRFTVCDMQSTPEAEEAVFGPLGDWLLGSILSDSEARAVMAERFERGYGRAFDCQNVLPSLCPVKLTGGDRSHSDAHLVVWEIMKIIWVYQNLEDLILHRVTERSLEESKEIEQGPRQKALAVFPGVFRTEKVTPIKHISRGESEVLLAEFAVSHDEAAAGWMSDCFDNSRSWASGVVLHFGEIHEGSGHPNVFRDGWEPTPPLRLKFFEYFLRRHAELRFEEVTFWVAEVRNLYEEFQESLAIFAHDDVEGRSRPGHHDISSLDIIDGSQLLTSFEPFPTVAYHG